MHYNVNTRAGVGEQSPIGNRQVETFWLSSLQQRCEALGLRVSSAEIEHIYHEVITLGERRKAVGDGDLRRIVDRLRAVVEPVSAAAPHVETVGYGHGV